MALNLPPRGRGTASNPHNRYAPTRSQQEDDGWYQDETPPSRATEVRKERAKTAITRNNSPDVLLDPLYSALVGRRLQSVYRYR